MFESFSLYDLARYAIHMVYSHLVYPIPEVGGLGVHSTMDLQGNLRFGPDVEWVDEVNYVVRVAKTAWYGNGGWSLSTCYVVAGSEQSRSL